MAGICVCHTKTSGWGGIQRATACCDAVREDGGEHRFLPGLIPASSMGYSCVLYPIHFLHAAPFLTVLASAGKLLHNCRGNGTPRSVSLCSVLLHYARYIICAGTLLHLRCRLHL